MEKLLEVEQVETCYGKVKALKGISFSVEEGQIVALLGRTSPGCRPTRSPPGAWPISPRAGAFSKI